MALRSHRLSPRQRAALILVNGTLSDDEICRLLGPQAREWLIELAWKNLIEEVPSNDGNRPRPAPSRPLLGYQRNAARRSQVSTTVSGLREIDAIPSWASHSAKSG
jgi:hypothetical protein